VVNLNNIAIRHLVGAFLKAEWVIWILTIVVVVLTHRAHLLLETTHYMWVVFGADALGLERQNELIRNILSRNFHLYLGMW